MNIRSYIERATPVGEKSDGSLHYVCPWCNRERLEVDPHRHLWFCHRCQRGNRYKGTSLGSQQGDSEIPERDNLGAYAPVDEDSLGWRYLQEQRGLPYDLVRELHPHRGPDIRRVYIPVFLLRGNPPVYFLGRAMKSDMEEYMNPKLSDFRYRKHELLWGLHRLSGWTPEIVLCEGVFDAVWGRNRLALMGKSLSLPQARILGQLNPKEIILFLDGDVAPGTGTTMLLRLQEVGYTGRVSEIDLPLEADPDLVHRQGKQLGQRWRLQ